MSHPLNPGATPWYFTSSEGIRPFIFLSAFKRAKFVTKMTGKIIIALQLSVVQ